MLCGRTASGNFCRLRTSGMIDEDVVDEEVTDEERAVMNVVEDIVEL